MTDKWQWFTNFQTVHDHCWSVTIADNHRLYVRGVGDVPIHTTVNGVVKPLRLQNVLYVPHLRRNLTSTGRLTEKHVAIIHVLDEYKLISRDFLMTSITPTSTYSSYRCCWCFIPCRSFSFYTHSPATTASVKLAFALLEIRGIARLSSVVLPFTNLFLLEYTPTRHDMRTCNLEFITCACIEVNNTFVRCATASRECTTIFCWEKLLFAKVFWSRLLSQKDGTPAINWMAQLRILYELILKQIESIVTSN